MERPATAVAAASVCPYFIGRWDCTWLGLKSASTRPIADAPPDALLDRLLHQPRTVLFIGDSLMYGLFSQFACGLRSHPRLTTAEATDQLTWRQDPWFLSLPQGMTATGERVKQQHRHETFSGACRGHTRNHGHHHEACRAQNGCVVLAKSLRVCVCESYALQMLHNDTPPGGWHGGGTFGACIATHAPRAGDIVVHGSIGVHGHKHRGLLGAAGSAGSAAESAAATEEATIAEVEVHEVLETLSLRSSQPGVRGSTKANEASVSTGARRPWLIWRERTAQHFQTLGGHHTPFDKAAARPSATAEQQPNGCYLHPMAEMRQHEVWNRAQAPLLAAARVPVLPVWESTAAAADEAVGHPDCGRARSRGVGCRCSTASSWPCHFS